MDNLPETLLSLNEGVVCERVIHETGCYLRDMVAWISIGDHVPTTEDGKETVELSQDQLGRQVSLLSICFIDHSLMHHIGLAGGFRCSFDEAHWATI